MCVCVTCAGKISDNEQIIFIFTFTIKRPSKFYDLLESDKKRELHPFKDEVSKVSSDKILVEFSEGSKEKSPSNAFMCAIHMSVSGSIHTHTYTL